VTALWSSSDEDIWRFNAWKDNGTNPVLFKSSEKGTTPQISLIFELVVYIRAKDKTTEMCCGWCQLPLSELDRQMTHKLPIKGGSPSSELIIKDQDVHT